MSAIPAKRTSLFVETTIGDETIVMHLENGEFFSLTDSAAAIWRLIDGVNSRDKIVDELAKEYSASHDLVGQDVDEFLSQLGATGFVALD